MIAIRLVRSKLRKREEHHHHNAVHPEQVQCTTAAPIPATANPSAGGIVNPAMSTSTITVDSCCAQSQTSTIVPTIGNGCNGNQQQQQQQQERNPETASTMVYTTGTGAAEQFIWQFPPPYPPPNTPPPQYTLYNDQDTLVHGQHGQGFAKGFRKNLGGRWRRLVKRKPESETCAIPPELKDQLKTIYVY